MDIVRFRSRFGAFSFFFAQDAVDLYNGVPIQNTIISSAKRHSAPFGRLRLMASFFCKNMHFGGQENRNPLTEVPSGRQKIRRPKSLSPWIFPPPWIFPLALGRSIIYRS